MHTLPIISLAALITGGICAIAILTDILCGNKQQMMVMNFVYPISALYAGPLALVFYYTIGRKGISNKGMNMQGNMQNNKPFWQSVAIGTLHCGSGCTIGDLIAETLLLFLPLTLFGSRLAATWLVDYFFAFAFGIVFQYYSIKPMKKLGAKDTFIAAIKADTLSLTSWQVGMYGWMAIAFFVIFKHKIPATDPLFWFMMQVGMLLGFITAYPMNWWLIKKGIKEAM